MRGAACPILAVALLTSGCALLDARRQNLELESAGSISGTVIAAGRDDATIIVVLMAKHHGEWKIVDHFVREGSGRWQFWALDPGAYWMAAFVDENRNLVYERHEPAVPESGDVYVQLAKGQTRSGVELQIPYDGRRREAAAVDIAGLAARSVDEQIVKTLNQLVVKGEVVALDDARFTAENGELGHWRPIDFMVDVGAGVYFLEPYDPAKVPIAFVHGLSGQPREFEVLIEHLDRERLQPWLVFYPSGMRLSDVSDGLREIFAELRHRHGYERLFIVAHSMGGLVAREAILDHYEDTGRTYVRLLVTISTPWGGNERATSARNRPRMVSSWRDVGVGAPFLEGLFHKHGGARRTLPPHLEFHLLFSHRRNALVPGPSGDGVVTTATELRWEAQREARSVFGFDEDHSAILRSPATARLLNEILAQAVR